MHRRLPSSSSRIPETTPHERAYGTRWGSRGVFKSTITKQRFRRFPYAMFIIQYGSGVVKSLPPRNRVFLNQSDRSAPTARFPDSARRPDPRRPRIPEQQRPGSRNSGNRQPWLSLCVPAESSHTRRRTRTSQGVGALVLEVDVRIRIPSDAHRNDLRASETWTHSGCPEPSACRREDYSKQQRRHIGVSAIRIPQCGQRPDVSGSRNMRNVFQRNTLRAFEPDGVRSESKPDGWQALRNCPVTGHFSFPIRSQ